MPHSAPTPSVYRLGPQAGHHWFVDETGIAAPAASVACRPATIDAAPARLSFDLDRAALVPIDLQNDFLHPDGWFHQAGRPGAAPLAHIDRLTDAARNAGVPVIWLNWGLTPSDLDALPPNTLFRGKRRRDAVGYGETLEKTGERVLRAGSWGADLVADLVRDADDHLIEKKRFSGFPDTGLEALLRRLERRTLFFCGINTDRCVFETLTDASALGFDCVLLEDACATVSAPEIEAAVVWLVRELHGFTASSSDFLAQLDHNAGKRTAP